MQRSRNLITGQDLVLKSVRSKKARIVLIATDIGESSKKKINDKCSYYEVPIFEIGEKQEISKAIGQDRSVIATQNEGFAKSLITKLKK